MFSLHCGPQQYIEIPRKWIQYVCKPFYHCTYHLYGTLFILYTYLHSVLLFFICYCVHVQLTLTLFDTGHSVQNLSAEERRRETFVMSVKSTHRSGFMGAVRSWQF